LPQRASTQTGLLAVSLLTLFAFAIAGYHPFAEDGGVYAAGVEKLLNPSLFPTWTAFVTGHLRFSLFAPVVAGTAHLTQVSLGWMLLLLHLLSIWSTLFAAWLLATRLTPSQHARLAAVSLLACWLTLPIAGTSLMLMDPYLTARGFTTPLALLALTWALDALTLLPLTETSRPSERSEEPLYLVRSFRFYPETFKARFQLHWASPAFDPAIAAAIPLFRSVQVMPQPRLPGDFSSEALRLPSRQVVSWLPCVATLLLAVIFHPLMGGYALAAVLCLAAVHTRKMTFPLILSALALALASILQALAPPETPSYLSVALTRYYWFLSQWQWYELFGLIAPLLILCALRKRGTVANRLLAETALLLGAIAFATALLFAHESYATHLVARLQPLRAFQIVYELMILLLGAWLGANFLSSRPWRWTLFLLALGTPLFVAERFTFPASAHIEWPNAAQANPWQQAFTWIRDNTPTQALFALDAHYITQGRHEDAQCFRAIAQRSALPDYSKDGGEASINPALTPAWDLGQTAQANLESEPDSLREAKLKPLGVTWIILESSSSTAFTCPYRNHTVKVCRLP
jgi:hypothetical protein